MSMFKNLIRIFLLILFICSCNKDQIELSSKSNESLNLIADKLVHDKNFSKLVDFAIFNNEIGIALSSEKFTSIQKDNIIKAVNNNEISRLIDGELVDSPEITNFIQNIIDQSNTFISSNRLILKNLTSDELNYVLKVAFIEISSNYKIVDNSPLIVRSCTDDCVRLYNLCKGDAVITAGAVFATGYTLAAGTAIYSGGTFTPAAGGILLTGIVGSGFTYGAEYWICYRHYRDCIYQCNSGGGGTSGPDCSQYEDCDHIKISNINKQQNIPNWYRFINQ